MEKYEKQRLGVGFLGFVIGGFLWYASSGYPVAFFLGGILGFIPAAIFAILMIQPPD